MADTSSYAQDFLAGIDPLGIYTSQYGQKAEQAGLSEGQHKTKQLVSVLGGVAGGGVLIPSLVSGSEVGLQRFMEAKGPFSQRAASFGAGFLTGAVKPWKHIQEGIVAKRAIQKTLNRSKNTTLSKKEQEAIQNIIENQRISDLIPGRKKQGPNQGLIGKGRSAWGYMRLRKGVLTQHLAKQMKDPVSAALTAAAGPLGIAGGVGAFGAGIQYEKGRHLERKFKDRLQRNPQEAPKTPMIKWSSVNQSALCYSFDSELSKIAAFGERAAYNLGKAMRAITREPKRKRDALYRKYLAGMRGAPFSPPKPKKIPNYLILPASLSLGAGAGIALNSKSKKSRVAALAGDQS